MRVGVITGTGSYELAGAGEPEHIATAYGTALVSRGTVSGVEVLHVSRHEEGHRRLSNHVNHRANVAALRTLEADCVISVTVCGATDTAVPLGSLIVFDDLHYLANRLPDGSLCTFYTEPGDPQRGHWIYGGPFSPEVRAALLAGAREAGQTVRDGGCYAHVDGPRFNTRSEIRLLAGAGVTAVSQTAAPEAVLCGELEMPHALLGYATDYANGVGSEPTPVEELLRLIGASKGVFASVLSAALPVLAREDPSPAGIVYRFD